MLQAKYSDLYSDGMGWGWGRSSHSQGPLKVRSLHVWACLVPEGQANQGQGPNGLRVARGLIAQEIRDPKIPQAITAIKTLKKKHLTLKLGEYNNNM